MKHTISHKISKMFILLLAAVLILCWFINCTFLVQFYSFEKREALLEAYETINETALTDTVDSQNFYVTMEQLCGKGNLSIIILGENDQVLFASTNQAEMFMLHRQILEYIYGYEDYDENTNQKTLFRGSKYIIQLHENRRTNLNYMEMWGELEQGGYFLIRTPIESIQESVSLSNRFLTYIGIMAILFSAVLIHLVTKRITRPIRELAKISEEMAKLNFDVRYQPDGTYEIDELGENMNQLSGKLEGTISELKTANNELKNDIERKTKEDEMRREFLSNVSHELKTPIALIQGYAEGLMEGAFEDEESKAFYCEVIMDEAGKMNNMVKSLLELNQIEFGDEKLEFQRIDIVELVEGVLMNFRLTCEQNDIQVLFDVKGPVYVWGDEFKIEEIFRNFLTNAIHHADGEKKIEVKIMMQDQNVEISVFNTGKPIPEEDIPRIWDKFYKVDKARTREYGGNGIGLSIVKAIMESIHKPYGVENYENGVRFYFVLDGNDLQNQLSEKRKNDKIKDNGTKEMRK